MGGSLRETAGAATGAERRRRPVGPRPIAGDRRGRKPFPRGPGAGRSPLSLSAPRSGRPHRRSDRTCPSADSAALRPSATRASSPEKSIQGRPSTAGRMTASARAVLISPSALPAIASTRRRASRPVPMRSTRGMPSEMSTATTGPPTGPARAASTGTPPSTPASARRRPPSSTGGKNPGSEQAARSALRMGPSEITTTSPVRRSSAGTEKGMAVSSIRRSGINSAMIASSLAASNMDRAPEERREEDSPADGAEEASQGGSAQVARAEEHLLEGVPLEGAAGEVLEGAAPDLSRLGAQGVGGAGHRARARAGDPGDGHPLALQHLQHAQVGEAAGSPAPERQPDARRAHRLLRRDRLSPGGLRSRLVPSGSPAGCRRPPRRSTILFSLSWVSIPRRSRRSFSGRTFTTFRATSATRNTFRSTSSTTSLPRGSSPGASARLSWSSSRS